MNSTYGNFLGIMTYCWAEGFSSKKLQKLLDLQK